MDEPGDPLGYPDIEARRFDVMDAKAKEIENAIRGCFSESDTETIADILFRFALEEDSSGRRDGIEFLEHVRSESRAKAMLLAGVKGNERHKIDCFLGWAKNNAGMRVPETTGDPEHPPVDLDDLEMQMLHFLETSGFDPSK